MVHELLRDLGGMVEVTGDGGATFVITLPVAPELPEMPEAPEGRGADGGDDATCADSANRATPEGDSA